MSGRIELYDVPDIFCCIELSDFDQKRSSSCTMLILQDEDENDEHCDDEHCDDEHCDETHASHSV